MSVVITSYTVERYTGNPLMRYRWLMLMFLSGGVTTIYLFIMPMSVGCWCRLGSARQSCYLVIAIRPPGGSWQRIPSTVC